ncbi:MAG: hypothetical protein RMJ87_12765 [Cytophagales bacterium]|nr:hypothetical protein [Bernardetiaceae bacterium]MDW8205893.1 hypothetical protein [Cytophagales bacterium]
MLQKIWNRLPLIYAFAVIILIIAPLLYISRYNHAGADDFEVSGLLMHTQSIWQTAMALMKRSAAYTGVFAQALFQPSDVQGIGFRLVPICIILAYLLTFYGGIAALLPQQSTFQERLLIAVSCFAIFFRLMESPMQTIFWSMSAIAYASSYVLAVGFATALVSYLCTSSESSVPSFVSYGVVGIAMLMAMGVQPVVSVLTVGLCIGVWLYALLRSYRKEKRLFLGLLVLMALLALAYLLTAPSTARRLSEGGVSNLAQLRLLSSAIFAFNMYRDYLAKWLSDSLLMLSSVVFVLWLVQKRIVPRLPIPIWMPFAATWFVGFLWFWIPKLLVSYIAARHMDMALVFFMTGWGVSLFYLAALVGQRCAVAEKNTWLLNLVFAAMLLTLLLPQYVSNMRQVWIDIDSGSAAQHDAEIKRRYAVMRLAGANELIALDTLQAMPLTIYKGDLIADTADWSNRAFAHYFQRRTVTVKSR